MPDAEKSDWIQPMARGIFRRIDGGRIAVNIYRPDAIFVKGNNKKLADLRRLRSLDLWDAPVTDAGIRHLLRLGELEELCLKGTGVTDEGLKELTNLRRLHDLFLDDTKVTEQGARVLKRALPGCHVWHGNSMIR